MPRTQNAPKHNFSLCSFLIECTLLFLSVGAFARLFVVSNDATQHKTTSETDTRQVLVDDTLNPRNLRTIVVVIDAWRFDFLSNRSAMPFLTQQAESGRAVVFNAHVQSPTVTMPRIQAITSGAIPLFFTVATNFFADEFTREDTWVRQLVIQQRRIAFFGDDTWFNMFPTSFLNASQGITSFLITDYTECDNDVKSNAMEMASNTEEWDVMILHFLGLDHIGHLLGGTSLLIDEKLKEMDNFLRLLYGVVSSDNPTLVVVVGDHGMTDAGSHGGSSHLESHVPLVFLHSQAKVKSDHTSLEAPINVEQVDLASSLPFFFRVDVSARSHGISLLPYLAKFWKIADELVKDQLDLSWNILDSLKTGDAFERSADNDIDESLKTLRDVQNDLILKTMSQWSSQLRLGFIFATITAVYLFATRIRNLQALVGNKFALIEVTLLSLPLVAIFASSLTEEEHEIWYYLVPTYAIVLIGKQLRQNKGIFCDTCKRLVYILFLHRIGMSLMMRIRRRWIMDSELLPSAIFSDSTLISNDLQDYATIRQLCSTIVPIISAVFLYVQLRPKCRSLWLVGCAVTLVVSVRLYTELLHNRLTNSYSTDALLMLVRIFFIYVSYKTGYVAAILYSLVVVPLELFPVVNVLVELARNLCKVKCGSSLLLMLLSCAFYYTGNSNSLSTIDVASGFRLISSYNAPLIAFQLCFCTYVGPIVLLSSIAYYSSESLSFAALEPFMIYRSISLFLTYFTVTIHSSHLFLWTVFTPKLIYELMHCVFLFVIMLLCAIRKFTAILTY